jgi:hypothetical protein
MNDITPEQALANLTHSPQAEGQSLDERLQNLQQQLDDLGDDANELDASKIKLDIAETLLALEKKERAWTEARGCFDVFLKNEHWQEAVESCNVLFQCDQPASVVALGQGVWLAVTYPIEVDTTVAMLNHIIDETPKDSDGAAVAAVSAHYIADIRSPEEKHESITFLTRHLIGKVAKDHSNVQSQEQLDAWMTKLELRDPEIFLPRLSQIITVMVADQWWFDRDELRSKLPQD